MIYNALGYTLADRTTRYEEARALIEKALALKPDDPFILDSMGWVLFKQGKYTEALGFLKKASADRDGEDATILDHLGDCLDKLKQKKPAIKNWKKALEVARKAERPDKKLIERIEKKLKDAGQKAKPPKKK